MDNEPIVGWMENKRVVKHQDDHFYLTPTQSQKTKM